MILTLPALFVGLMVTPKPVVIVDLKPREELRGQLTHPEADVAKIAKTHSLKLVETEGATVLLSEDALGIPSLRAKTRLVDALISALDPDSQVLRAERLPLGPSGCPKTYVITCGPLWPISAESLRCSWSESPSDFCSRPA